MFIDGSSRCRFTPSICSLVKCLSNQQKIFFHTLTGLRHPVSLHLAQARYTCDLVNFYITAHFG